MAKVYTPFRVEPDQALLLEQVARDRGVSRSEVLRELIRSLASTATQESESPLATSCQG